MKRKGRAAATRAEAGIRSARSRPILVAGGDADLNLHSLLAELEKQRAPHVRVLAGSETHPVLTWDLTADVLTIDGEAVAPRAVFLRHDVFSTPSAARAFAWYTTVLSARWRIPKCACSTAITPDICSSPSNSCWRASAAWTSRRR